MGVITNRLFLALASGNSLHPFSSPGTHGPITKILLHTKKCIFVDLRKKNKRCNFDSFTPAVIVLAVVISFIWQFKCKEVSAPD